MFPLLVSSSSCLLGLCSSFFWGGGGSCSSSAPAGSQRFARLERRRSRHALRPRPLSPSSPSGWGEVRGRSSVWGRAIVCQPRKREKSIPACQHLVITVNMWLIVCPWILLYQRVERVTAEGRRHKKQGVLFFFSFLLAKKKRKKDERAWWTLGRAAAASAVCSEEQNILEDRWRQDEQIGERWANHRRRLVSRQQVATHGDRRFPWVTVFFPQSEYAWRSHRQERLHVGCVTDKANTRRRAKKKK